jgi:hypothetical protein
MDIWPVIRNTITHSCAADPPFDRFIPDLPDIVGHNNKQKTS